MSLPRSRMPAAALLVALATIIAGCGKTSQQTVSGGGPVRKLAPVEAEGAVSITTRNTSRLGGANTAVDAAAIARAVYPGLTPGTRPQAVVLVDERNWPAALAASVLAGAPLNAPILYADANTLPAVSLQALEAMHPAGAAALSGTQVIRIGTEAPVPARYTVRTLPGATPSRIAVEVQRLLSQAGAGTPRRVIVMRLGALPAIEMPAAGLAAESATPILYAEGPTLGPATFDALKSMRHPSIYVLGAGTIGHPTLGVLARRGTVTRVPGGSGEGGGPAANAIAIARFTDGNFGWGVKEPGHGLVFANPRRPLDAPPAALLSATADYGPLLLLEAGGTIPPELSAYLGDIQPAYSSAPEYQPVRGVYNHGWLIGDELAAPLTTQAELDSLLEISPRQQGASPEASVLGPE